MGSYLKVCACLLPVVLLLGSSPTMEGRQSVLVQLSAVMGGGNGFLSEWRPPARANSWSCVSCLDLGGWVWHSNGLQYRLARPGGRTCTLRLGGCGIAMGYLRTCQTLGGGIEMDYIITYKAIRPGVGYLYSVGGCGMVMGCQIRYNT